MLFAFAAAIFGLRHCALNCHPNHGWQPVRGLAAFVSMSLSLLTFPVAGADSVDLRPITKVGSFRQTRVMVEVEGKLKLNPDGEEVKHLPLKVCR
jgi:hypothetical protein